MNGPSVNPRRLTMPKAIERYFNLALYLLVLTGFATLASTGQLDLPAVILVGLALALRGYQLLVGREFVLPETWITVLTLLYILVYLVDYLFLSAAFWGQRYTLCCLRWSSGCSLCSGHVTTTCWRCSRF